MRGSYHPGAADDGVGAALEPHFGEQVLDLGPLLAPRHLLGQLEVGRIAHGVADRDLGEEDVVLQHVGNSTLEAAALDHLPIHKHSARHVGLDALRQHVEQSRLCSHEPHTHTQLRVQ